MQKGVKKSGPIYQYIKKEIFKFSKWYDPKKS